MTIIPGTLVQLPNGSNGVVIPSSWWQPGRVLVKLPRGRKRWFKVNECTPLPFGINFHARQAEYGES
ncbi:hypothetical protein ACQFX9_19125 [Aliinostoc sp. HNIBRCY26]|uniref:hypothetical protein n=1 Tax=Nostocales TaxID=1161 RepID=UPI000CA299E4|nr:hypothetical protein [Nostoc sp. CENA543]AUT00541.1 hypothetical protein CLI64_09145 [Nostoc sp. CENA543]